MKSTRLALYSLVGVLLGAIASSSFADTIPATPSTTNYTWTYGPYSGSLASVANSACVEGGPLNYPTYKNFSGVVDNESIGQFHCRGIWTADNSSVGDFMWDRRATKGAPIYTCPAGYDGPKTVGGQPNMCESQDKCASTKDKSFSGWVVKPSGGYSGTVCIDGCQYDQVASLDLSNPQDERIGKDGRIWGPVSQYGKGTSCTGTTAGGTTNDGTAPVGNNNDGKKAPCGGSDGVMTTTSGKVLCVPEGTPDARKPGVTQEKKSEVFQDGSKKDTLTTTTQDPQTSAKGVTVQVTVTAGPSGGTSAGTPGTSSSTSNTSGTAGSNGAGGSGEGGDGDCDPSLNFCGGPATDGIYTKKEKTMGSVLTEFQNTVKASAIGSASTGFFTVTTPSGSCPNWTVNVPMLNITLSAADYFCNGTILSALQGAGYVMLALATYIAFTWAFL